MEQMKNLNFYDFNNFLRFLNIFVLVTSIYLYSGLTESSNLVNSMTLCILGLLVFENIWILIYEERKRNPLIIILVFMTTVFYMARVLTLILDPISASYSHDVSANNYALIFIFFANLFMFIGFYVGSRHIKSPPNIDSSEGFGIMSKAMGILIFVMLFSWLGSLISGTMGRVIHFIHVWFTATYTYIVIILIVGIIGDFKKKTVIIRILLVAFIIFMCLLRTWTGSRSAIFGFLMVFLFCGLAIKNRVILYKKTIIIILILIPALILSFFIASVRAPGWPFYLTPEKVNLREHGWDYLKTSLRGIYNRIGFLDYSVEFIANREKYSKVIDIPHYIKAIIENNFTPGFDWLDIPRISNSVRFVAAGTPIPRKSELYDTSRYYYHSDQLGIYGDFYLLFGYCSLPVFFLVAFIFQKIFNIFSLKAPPFSFIYKAVLFFLFYQLLVSFGLDWFLFDVITGTFATLIFARVCVGFKARESRTIYG